jgi:hypothetical protein
MSNHLPVSNFHEPKKTEQSLCAPWYSRLKADKELDAFWKPAPLAAVLTTSNPPVTSSMQVTAIWKPALIWGWEREILFSIWFGDKCYVFGGEGVHRYNAMLRLDTKYSHQNKWVEIFRRKFKVWNCVYVRRWYTWQKRWEVQLAPCINFLYGQMASLKNTYLLSRPARIIYASG